ncbi:hypothetical protein QTN25_005914 [Entamoeba marina]
MHPFNNVDDQFDDAYILDSFGDIKEINFSSHDASNNFSDDGWWQTIEQPEKSFDSLQHLTFLEIKEPQPKKETWLEKENKRNRMTDEEIWNAVQQQVRNEIIKRRRNRQE